MRPFRDYPIQRKLTVVMLLTSATAVMLVCIAAVGYEFLRFRETILSDLNSKAEIIAANSAAALAFNDAKAARETLLTMHARQRILSARIYKPDGSLFAEYVRAGATVPLLPREFQRDGYSSFEGGLVIVCRSIPFEDEEVGVVVLRADLKEQRTSFYVYAGIMSGVLLVSLLAALLVSRRLQRLITDPLLALTFVAHTVSQLKDYSMRAVKQSEDEIGDLTDEFNEMLARIERRDAALQTSEERFRQIAENVREVFWMTNPKKSEMLYISPGYERVWGRSCASLYAQPQDWAEAIHPGDRARVLAAALHKQADGAYDEEYRIVRPDGTTRWIRDRAFPVRDAQGEVYRIAGIAEDVTERRRLEDEIVQNSEREQVRIGQDLHDGLCQHLMRTGLASNLLERDLAAKSLPEAVVAQKISALLQDALAQARSVARGLYPVKLEAEGLASALKEMAVSLSQHSTVRFTVDTEEPALIGNHLVAVHLYRIAQEAVNNAMRHASPGHIAIRLTASREKIQLQISDDGTGIVTPAQRGQGMGLHIMAYRAHVIGGTVNVKRGDPGGTVVSCTTFQNDAR